MEFDACAQKCARYYVQPKHAGKCVWCTSIQNVWLNYVGITGAHLGFAYAYLLSPQGYINFAKVNAALKGCGSSKRKHVTHL